MYYVNMDKKTSGKIQVLRIALISIISNALFVLFVGLLFILYTRTLNSTKVDPIVSENDEITDTNSLIPEDTTNNEIEKYNNSVWQKYYNEWKLTKEKMRVFTSCKSQVDTVHLSLEDKHKEYLRAEIKNTKSKELNYYEGIYGYTEEISNNLENIINTYRLNTTEPYALNGMYLDEEKPQYTKETSTIRLKQVVSDFERIRKHANSLNCLGTNVITYTDKEKICNTLIELNYSAMDITHPIYREAFEIDELYELALKEKTDEKNYALYECKNDSYSYR